MKVFLTILCCLFCTCVSCDGNDTIDFSWRFVPGSTYKFSGLKKMTFACDDPSVKTKTIEIEMLICIKCLTDSKAEITISTLSFSDEGVEQTNLPEDVLVSEMSNIGEITKAVKDNLGLDLGDSEFLRNETFAFIGLAFPRSPREKTSEGFSWKIPYTGKASPLATNTVSGELVFRYTNNKEEKGKKFAVVTSEIYIPALNSKNTRSDSAVFTIRGTHMYDVERKMWVESSFDSYSEDMYKNSSGKQIKRTRKTETIIRLIN